MEVFFARQPIFDRSRAVVGYELLYRGRPDSVQAEGVAVDVMALQVLVDAVLSIGLDVAAAGRTAFINVPPSLLLDGPFDMIEPGRIVIELLESVQPDAETAAAVRALIRRGYRIALDDYTLGDAREPLAGLAHILKLDVLGLDRDAILSLVQAQRGHTATLLAEKVEDEAAFQACLEAGCQLFQGFFFQRPELVRQADLSPSLLHVIELVNLLVDPDKSDTEIEDRFRSNVELSWKLLRMANAAGVSGRHVESIGHAIRMLGRTVVHRWVSLLLVASIPRESAASRELTRIALTRARFCEQLFERHGAFLAGQAFLVGLFSQLDVLVKVPLEELLARISLPPDTKVALLERRGRLGTALQVATAYERADWERVDALLSGLAPLGRPLADMYVAALTWAEERAALLL